MIFNRPSKFTKKYFLNKKFKSKKNEEFVADFEFPEIYISKGMMSL